MKTKLTTSVVLVLALTCCVASSARTTEAISVELVFDRMPGAFVAEKAADMDAVFQFDLSGPDGGRWYVVVRGGTCHVRSGSHHAPTSTIGMTSDDFLSMIAGELTALRAFSSGRMRVDGDMLKSRAFERLFDSRDTA